MTALSFLPDSAHTTPSHRALPSGDSPAHTEHAAGDTRDVSAVPWPPLGVAGRCGFSRRQLRAALGTLVVRGGGAVPRLHYHPCWDTAVAEVTAQGLSRNGRTSHLALQCRALGRLLWGAALLLGCDVSTHPRRAAYPLGEVDLDVVRWALADRGHLSWLLCYSRAVLRAHGPHASLSAGLDWFRDQLALLADHAPARLPPLSGARRAWPPVRSHPAAAALSSTGSAPRPLSAAA